MLTLKRLTEHADSTVVLDNTSLDRIVEKNYEAAASFDQANALIATVMSASTQTLRFPGFMVNDLSSLVGCLVPTPRLHFLISGYTPISGLLDQKQEGVEEQIKDQVKQMYEFKTTVVKTSVLDVMRRLLHPHNCMVSCSRDGCYLSLLNIVSGQVDVGEI